MENRLSFNRPIAESTFRASISNSPTFHWGRNNLNNSVMNQSITKSPVRERTGLSKIDARIYIDAQSRGLTSRIVKYHENQSSHRLNRSISMNNLSSERQFPATRTTKPELMYKTSKQNISMTHIAPPSKSAFYGNTLSGLLRSSSVITLQHNDDDISSENRPIMHPPVTEKELHPTRSVLEVLKEISRKRINNEDADEAETSKKYCNRVDSDVNSNLQMDNRNTFTQISQSYKRQRESTAEFYNQSRFEQQAYLSKPTQNRQEASSPEQHAKRRHCNYNNDITSSLSSSRKSNNKRKLFDSEGDAQQEKQLRFQSEIRLPELSNALNYVAKIPITPLPNTPQSSHPISSNEIPIAVPVQKSISALATTNSTKQTNLLPEKPKLTLFNKNYDPNSEESVDERASDVEGNDYCGIQFVKPKKAFTSIGSSASHLLMERTQKSKLALMLSGLRGERYLGEEDSQSDVKDKKTEGKPNSSTEPLKATPNEIKQINNTSVFSTPSSAVTSSVSTTSTLAQPIVTTSIANKSNTNIVDGSTPTSIVFALGTSPKTTTPTAPTSKITSPLTGIKLTPQTTTIATTTVIPPIVSVAPTFSFGIGNVAPPISIPNSSVTQTGLKSASDALQAPKTNNTTPFTIGTPPKTASVATTTSQPLLPTFGAATGQQNMSVSSINPTATVPTTTLATNTTASTLPKTFSFGSNPISSTISSTTNATTAQSVAPVAATTPLFAFESSGSQPSFNTNNVVSAASSSENAKPTTAVATSFSFGGNKTSSGGFSFSATANTATNPLPIKDASKAFNFTTPKISSAAGGFSFASTTENNSNTPNLFGNTTITPIKFGSTTTQQQNAAQSQPAATNAFGFGSKIESAATQEKVATSTTSSSTFGGLIANNQSKPFSFGAVSTSTSADASKGTNIFSLNNNDANKSFNFGGSITNTTTPPTATTNTFSSAGNNNNSSNLFNFGGSNTNNKNNATSTDSPKPVTTFGFGNNAQSKPFSFGATNGEAPKLAFGGDQNKAFSFGGVANNTISGNEAPKVNSTFNFSTTNNTFSFGGISNKPNTNDPTKMPSNTASNTAPTNSFTFGGAKSPLSQSNTFSATPSGGQSNIFNFSGGNANSGSTSSINNTATVKPTNQQFNGFSGSAFAFGAGDNIASSAGKPTAFGTASNTTPQSSTFVFGGGSNNNATSTASTGNLFANSNSVNNTPPSLFGGTGNTSAGSNVNLFAAPPQTSSDRPIRRATRRLTKS